MREVDLTVSFKVKVIVDDDSAEHVQDKAVRDFVKGDLKFSLSGLVKEGMEISKVSKIIFV
jgi:hypothetical protein